MFFCNRNLLQKQIKKNININNFIKSSNNPSFQTEFLPLGARPSPGSLRCGAALWERFNYNIYCEQSDTPLKALRVGLNTCVSTVK